MGTSLTGLKIKDSYSGLLKTTDNGGLGATEKLITDGLGNSSGVYLGTSGNVGIGVVPYSSAQLLNLKGSGLALRNDKNGNNNNWSYISNESTGDQSTLNFSTGNAANAMNIDHSGNVGIGYSGTAQGKVDIRTTVGSTFLNLQGTNETSNGETALIRLWGTQYNTAGRHSEIANVTSGSTASNNLVFRTNATERMRITSGGGVQIFGNPTSSPYEGAIIEDVANGCRFNIGRSANAILLGFYNQNGIVGNIQTSGSSTSYNTSSDYRLKEDWQPMADALTRVDALNPVNFAWKADGSRVDGFLAHELQEVIPEAVTGTKDAMRDEKYEVSPAVYEDVVHPAVDEVLDEEGNILTPAQEEWTEQVLVSEAVMGTRSVPDYQGIDQSKIVPLLVAAIQELKAEVDALKGA